MSTAWNIVLVDDDEAFCEMLKAQIELDGEFEVAVAPNAVRGIQLAKVEHVDLLIFDVGLPDLDGREAVRVLRKSGVKIPIIMLSGRDSDADQILGLDAGADDYITKPFEFSVLLARIRVQLRRRERSEDAVFSIGSYTFVPAFKILIKDSGSKLQLTQKETSILKFLCRAGKKVVPRDVLFHEVWGYNTDVKTHTVETHIYRLRQKFEKDPSHPELLVAETGGYKLVL